MAERTVGSSLSLLVNAARVSPPLREAVALIEAEIAGLRLSIEQALDQLQGGRHHDAEDTLRRVLESGSRGEAP